MCNCLFDEKEDKYDIDKQKTKLNILVSAAYASCFALSSPIWFFRVLTVTINVFFLLHSNLKKDFLRAVKNNG